MAIRHGLAGQYAKDKATKRFLRIMFILFAIVPWGFVAYGFVWGYFWYRWGALPALVPLVAVAALLWVAWRKLWPYVDQISRDRMRYLRGCQGEALVAWLLERELGEEWHVFNGIQVEDGCDIDHVVVGPGGLFCVSTKSQRGTFNGTIDGLLYNGTPSPFAKQAAGQASALSKWLAGRVSGKVPWVRAMLAVPFGYTYGDACDGNVWLVHQDTLTDRIAPEPPRKELSTARVREIVDALKVLPVVEPPALEPWPPPAPAR